MRREGYGYPGRGLRLDDGDNRQCRVPDYAGFETCPDWVPAMDTCQQFA
jgi:hypothetical protein